MATDGDQGGLNGLHSRSLTSDCRFWKNWRQATRWLRVSSSRSLCEHLVSQSSLLLVGTIIPVRPLAAPSQESGHITSRLADRFLCIVMMYIAVFPV
jgi:hypothetical protein